MAVLLCFTTVFSLVFSYQLHSFFDNEQRWILRDFWDSAFVRTRKKINRDFLCM